MWQKICGYTLPHVTYGSYIKRPIIQQTFPKKIMNLNVPAMTKISMDIKHMPPVEATLSF